jgi:uncharacterized protein (TIGR02996 family)
MTDDAFLQTIQEKPSDDTTRLIYADWLEERDDEVSLTRARFIRADCELALLPGDDKRRKALRKRRRELATRLDASWLAVVSKLPIEKCSFTYECPLKWENLQPVDGSAIIRFCDKCERNVYYSASIEDARSNASIGLCVAIDARLARHKGDLDVPDFGMTMGIIDPSYFEPRLRRPEDTRGE